MKIQTLCPPHMLMSEVRGSLVVRISFLELHSKTALQHSAEVDGDLF